MKRLFIKKLKEYNAYKQYRRNFSLFRYTDSEYQGKLMPRYKILQTILRNNYPCNKKFALLIDFSFIWSQTDEDYEFFNFYAYDLNPYNIILISFDWFSLREHCYYWERLDSKWRIFYDNNKREIINYEN